MHTPTWAQKAGLKPGIDLPEATWEKVAHLYGALLLRSASSAITDFIERPDSYSPPPQSAMLAMELHPDGYIQKPIQSIADWRSYHRRKAQETPWLAYIISIETFFGDAARALESDGTTFCAWWRSETDGFSCIYDLENAMKSASRMPMADNMESIFRPALDLVKQAVDIATKEKLSDHLYAIDRARDAWGNIIVRAVMWLYGGSPDWQGNHYWEAHAAASESEKAAKATVAEQLFAVVQKYQASAS